jgi:hypothetical protein
MTPVHAVTPASAAKISTHWMDDRGLVIAAEDRDRRGGDWVHFYNVPCTKIGRKVKPLHLCGHCSGAGKDPACPYDPCPKCGKSGGLAEPAPASSLSSS